MKHTATPWIQVEGGRFGKEVEITTEDRIERSVSPICEMDVEFDGEHGQEQNANAEFIVRACNSHDDLAHALRTAIFDLEFSVAIIGKIYPARAASISQVLVHMRETLSKAGAK